MFCFPNTGHVIILERTVFFFQISSYSRAYLRIIYEKIKGQVPLGPLLGKQNIQAVKAAKLKTQKQTKRIEIHQSQTANHDLLSLLK